MPFSIRLIPDAGVLALVLGLALATPTSSADIDLLPPTVIFVTSSGFWEDEGTHASPDATVTPAPTGGQAATAGRRGYYKLIAVRQADRTARVYLQQIAVSETGPTVVSSIELDEITALKAYVSDIRPERPGTGAPQPGLFATILLKTDPNATEPESWTVMIDDLGELKVEKATN